MRFVYELCFRLRVGYSVGAAIGTFTEYWKKCSECYAGPNIIILARAVAASEGEPDLAHLKLLDELEIGEKYELVITNLSGFYRYRMRDVFLVTGKHNETPTIEYQYRVDKTVGPMGEKTAEITPAIPPRIRRENVALT